MKQESPQHSAFPQVDLNALPAMPVTPRSPLRYLLDDYLWWSRRRKVDVHYLTGFDVTAFVAFEKECRLARKRPPSLVAYFVRCIGTTFLSDPTVMAALSGPGLYVPAAVNVALMVSANTPSGDPIPYLLEIKGVDTLSLDEIGTQLAERSRSLRREGVADSPTLQRAAWLGRRRRSTRRLLYALCALNPNFKKYLSLYSTHVGLTSVTQYTGRRSCWAMPVLPFSFNIALGALTRKPLVVGEEIAIRDCLDVTIVWDHGITDGVRCLEMVNRLGTEVESGRLLAEFGAGATPGASG